MTTLTASKARSKLYRLIDETAMSHQPIVISGKRAQAVLLSADDWKAIQETLYLLSIPDMRESIRKGLKTPVEKCAKDLKW
jgi:prevent-host-death family protein